MTDAAGSPSLSEKALIFAEKIFDALWGAVGPQDAWHWAIMILMILIAVGIVAVITFKTLGSAIEHLVKLVEAYKSSGLPMWLSVDNKARVRRRKQFCGVLDADLAYLAKAENWNDQYFTDLEAEVETEGGYYATAWDRMRRRKSFGLRKERSLIRAITSSAERAMQLVGEPGSGKSVALRHLAKQFAEQGRKSNDKNATVPLYVNLREMDGQYSAAITADDVRMFVLDNIRRGDADTSAFVRENWDDYCHRGIWLFLFDSFDEIPAVLHSEAGSDIVKQYSQAIRQFLEGMGECKGILASREFKGPEALPWKKLRILSLTGEKQDELIDNSFLNESQMSLVRQHLANSHSSIGATPLFLTLLCRYVKDEQRGPNNDHDILLQHIERLARREPAYLQRKYKLSVEDLINGAERLARLFAEDESLSLAPTLDQIATQLQLEEVPGGSIERLISALVDCKIGRADVPNAAHGDRRFAFAHRRYQEALFVRYLARHPEAISATELLRDPRWREYTVTLLQTRPSQEIQYLLDVACAILELRADQQEAIGFAEPPLPTQLMYFDWSVEVAVPLLSLLQEGLSRRLQDVPDTLSNAVRCFLELRWKRGDTWDRCEVLRLGGLLPQDTLVNYLVEVFDNGTESERAQAFRLATFTSSLPESAREFVLAMLSDQVLEVKNRAEQLNLEAIAARLPTNIGANFVVNRCNRIRRNFRWLLNLVSFLRISYSSSIVGQSTQLIINNSFESIEATPKNQIFLPTAVALILPLVVLIALTATCVNSLTAAPSLTLWLMSIITGVATLTYILMFCPYLVRSIGKAITVSDSIKWIRNHFKLGSCVLFVLILCSFGAGVFLIGWPLGFAINWVARNYLNFGFISTDTPSPEQLAALGIGAIISLFYALTIVMMVVNARRDRQLARKQNGNLEKIRLSESSDVGILYSASSIDELIGWLKSDDTLLSQVKPIREFSSFVLEEVRQVLRKQTQISRASPSCLSSNEKSIRQIKHVRQIVERRFIELHIS